MKQLEEILNQEPIYLHDWEVNKRIGVISDFEDIYISKEDFEAIECPIPNIKYWLEKKIEMEQKIKEWEGINILFASYSYENYSGDAFVLFERGGKLFEVNGGHCSCHGLEHQFEPEETTLDSLQHRLVSGRMGQDDYSGNEFANELKQFLGI